ncbi:LEA type 2 family protein [Pontibacter sp. MBLB2868]|uniref:LEA type 2 family protein n=1 Tax=Pontibacter sp. MBLB2868 TaxID=3451555 RepID=UPI003F753453
MSNKKTSWILIVSIILLALLGAVAYYILTKKYFPKVAGVEYLKLELGKDTAQVKAGVKVINRIPLPITIDSVRYNITDEGDTLGWGKMTTTQTLPALDDETLDFQLKLDFERYRKHLQEQQGKDSIRLDIAMNVYFDLPLISPKSITINRHFNAPVAKSPALELQDIVVRSFSPDSGYSLLLKINSSNKNLPGLKINNLQYNVQIGDTLTIAGEVDSTFSLQKGNKLLEVPLQLNTSDAISLIKKKLSGDESWKYDARLEANIQSDHPLFDSFKLVVEKAGELDVSKMGTGKNYLPTIKRIKRLTIDSDEEQTRLQADLVVHNPAPIPFYIDSAAYYVRYQGKVIATGKQNIEKTLPKSGDQSLGLQLLVDESAYKNLMKKVQGQDKIPLQIELKLIYNLPGAKRQQITLQREIQAPVPGQAGIKVAGLEVKELDPEKGAQLTLKLQVESSNLPDLQIKNLEYKLNLSEGILLTGNTQEPIRINQQNALVEVPVHLSADDVNQLLKRAIKGSTDWKYHLKASATLQSSNKMIGPTKVNLEFEGELELKKGTGGQQLMPKITKIDTLDITIAYDTAWVKLNVRVQNPLPVPIHIDNLTLLLTHQNDTIAITNGDVGKKLPAEGEQTGWITLAVNYKLWREHLIHHQENDSMFLKEKITLQYRIAKLEQQQVSFTNTFQIPTPKLPVTELQKVKLRGFSFTKGILVNALVKVQNANTEKLEINAIEYNACVQDLLDVCGSINRTYDIPLGISVVKVPMNLGIGEVFRAMFARLAGKNKERKLYLNSNAIINTSNPKLQNTYIRFEKWEKSKLFQKKEKSAQ